ncbi:hypothetical protein Goari_022037, partial [Gossypium aridum]|nr:hypothetical protein [Gossypium aridum]
MDLGFTTIEVEGDAIYVVKKLQKERDDKLEICAYIKDGQGLNGLKKGDQCLMRNGFPGYVREEVERD